LNDLRDRLTAHCGRDYGFHIGNIDSVPGDLVAIDIDQQARLPELAHDGEFGEPGHVGECVLDLDGFVLKYAQIVTIYFDGQRAFEPSQCFIHGIFGGLGIVENNAGEGCEFLVDRFGELFFSR